MLIISIPCALSLDHIKKDIQHATFKFPVPPMQEAEDQMRKWNTGLQQELTLMFVTARTDTN